MKLDKPLKKVGLNSNIEFTKGYNACAVGTEKHRNPHANDSEAYEWWRRGWENRYYNDPSEKL